MAIFKSQVLTQASGSVGGMTYTRTSSGMTLRARSMPVNPSTSRQQVVRNAMSELTTAWVETLTEPQRIGWADYARNVSVRNKLGDAIHLSGISMYIRCNTPRLQVREYAPSEGIGRLDNAPTIFDTGEPLIAGVVSQGALTPFTVELGWSNPAGAVGDVVVVYVSKPQNQSVNFFRGPYQYNALALLDIETAVDLIPNPTWIAGQVIHVRARILYADGRLSPATEYRQVLANTPV